MSRKERPTTTASAPAPPPDPEQLPPWLPTGDRWNDLPKAVRQAVPRVLVPAYRQFVLDAPDELQRSIGLTLVHLLWLELCNQMHMVDVVADPTSPAAILNDPDKMIDQHLNLVAAKSQTTELLIKLRLVDETLAAVSHRSVPLPGTSSAGLAAPVTVHRPGTGPFFGPSRAEKYACPLAAAEPASTSELENPAAVDQQSACRETPEDLSGCPSITPLSRFGRGAGGEGRSQKNSKAILGQPPNCLSPGPDPASDSSDDSTCARFAALFPLPKDDPDV